ncbi:MAG TPA: ferritin-like domain-containing protein [Vicinamibacteria bacterium]|nr:ferritin-like domain-containing protein [Vicinamibacteria bacterium]
MILSREEMTFDFGDARFDVQRDRSVLVWIFSQFLYGEVTGIQVGHWLYRAPSLDAANFLARQAVEELQHVDRFRDIIEILDASPETAHPAVRFLSSGMMGDDWAEHVLLEMALGEGYVLDVLYALIDTIEHERIVSILRRATRQEERHVAFGEDQTRRAIEETPGIVRRLRGLALWSLVGIDVLARAVARRGDREHPVLRQFPGFLRHVRQNAETRLLRLGVLDRPVSHIGFCPRWGNMCLSAASHLVWRYWPWKRPPLTKTYLTDRRIRTRVSANC